MKKFLISAVFIVGFVSYATYNYFTTNTAQAVAAPANSPVATDTVQPTTQASGASAPPDTTTSATQTTAPSTVSTHTTTPTSASSGKYKDGTYTGSVADAYYGNIQVKAVISGGKLTNVVFLQYPNDRSTSRYINQQAMPELKAEAIQSQSANVDGVSGASDSSAAFKESLGSALSQAAV